MKNKRNRLPQTVLNLGNEVGITFTVKGAREIKTIERRTYGPYTTLPYRWSHYLDFNMVNDHFLRSPHIASWKRLRTLYRRSVRRVAEFLQKNQG